LWRQRSAKPLFGGSIPPRASKNLRETKRFSGWREEFLGSIAEKVVKQIECPLLLLRSVKPGLKVDQEQTEAVGAVLAGTSRH